MLFYTRTRTCAQITRNYVRKITVARSIVISNIYIFLFFWSFSKNKSEACRFKRVRIVFWV